MTELGRRTDGALTVDAPDQGKHLIAYLGAGRSDLAVEEAARRRGVIARAISPMYRKASPRAGLLLGFTGYSRNAIVSSAAALAEALGERGARVLGGQGRRRA